MSKPDWLCLIGMMQFNIVLTHTNTDVLQYKVYEIYHLNDYASWKYRSIDLCV